MKRLWNRFQLLSRAKQIGISIAAIHALILFALVFNHSISKSFAKAAKPIAVRTALIPQKTIAASPQNLPKESQPVPKRALQKKEQKPRQEKKEIAAKSTRSEKPSKPSDPLIDPAVLQQITAGLEALASVSSLPPEKNALAVPSLIEITSDSSFTKESPAYSATIAALLQQNLYLPEIGDVVARIEIDSKGTVIKCEILSEKSRKNSEFLKKRLRELAFPCFNEFGLTEARMDFTITFRNVENR